MKIREKSIGHLDMGCYEYTVYQFTFTNWPLSSSVFFSYALCDEKPVVFAENLKGSVNGAGFKQYNDGRGVEDENFRAASVSPTSQR